MNTMDLQMEVSLLIKRFPERSLEDLGPLIKDFFCARSEKPGIYYGGRLFVTQKMLVFVSTNLDSKAHDCCIPIKDITMTTTIHRRIISSLEVQWTKRKNCFTNFYDLKSVERTLREVLSPEKVTVKTSGSLKKRVRRIASFPIKEPSHTSSSQSLKPKLEPCPYFTKCGFCPRGVVCKLDHTFQTDQETDVVAGQDPKTASKDADLYSTNNTSSDSDSISFKRSPMKKPHVQPMAESRVSDSDDTVKYLRSISSPIFIADSKSETKKSSSDEREISDQYHLTSKDLIPTTDESSSSNSSSNFKPVAKELTLPESFNFSTQLSHTSSSSNPSEEFRTPPSDSAAGLSLLNSAKNVFVFSASSPTSPPKGKRKDAIVDFVLPKMDDRGVVGKEEGEEGAYRSGSGVGAKGRGDAASKEMELLIQQLELGSDDDSLHGDLDVETQMRIIESLSYGKIGESSEAPPPYSSLDHQSSFSSESETPPEGAHNTKEGRGHKRQPCYYFLSGYCKNGLECPDYHGMDPDVEEFEFSIPSRIRVHSGSGIGRSDINSGDKIILPPQILMACEQQELSYPIAFRMENSILGKVVYGGVLQFTSPSPDSAYLPQWMMEYLEVQDGEEISFQHTDLPKGTFVQLQPVSSSWLGIPFDKRMAMMEFQLRNFQTLTEGTRVTLTYELNKYTLKVLKCKPAKGISIVDADLTTDVIEPADLNRFHSVIEGQAENIEINEPKKCEVKSNAYRHFVLLSLPGKPIPSKIRIEVQSSSGDADLFLSQSFAAPLQSHYTWCNQDVGKSVIHLNSADDKNYDILKPLFAGVMGALEDAEFTITFFDESSQDSSAGSNVTSSTGKSGLTLRGVPSTDDLKGKPTSSSPEPLLPDHQQCSYCGSVMPSLRLLMHERHCAQSTFKCPLCQLCLPKNREKKHNSIAHQLLVCECGEEYTQLALHRHQETDCSKRTVKCPFKWCNLSFPMDQLASHENICGRKKTECPVCKEEVSHLELEMHLEAFHDVEVDKIDWEKPLSSQDLIFKHSQLKFKCTCGLSFQFQDDMQVHQLTECALRRMVEDEMRAEGGKESLISVDAATNSDIVG